MNEGKMELINYVLSHPFLYGSLSAMIAFLAFLGGSLLAKMVLWEEND